MTDYKKYINALRKCAKEHEDDRTSFGHIIVSDLCRDTANLLESLEQEPCEDCITLRLEKGTLKYSDKDYVVYKKEWLKKWWQPELALLGIELPSIQPTTKENLEVEDCISREAVIEHYNSGEILQCNHVSRNNLLNYIEGLPSIQPKPKTGHWIACEEVDDCNGVDLWYECSECGRSVDAPITEEFMLKDYPYCHCGAKMLPTGSDCDSCEYQNEVDGSNCYECVKGIRDNYTAEKE